MIAAPYPHLLWKEYRAIRGFWIALVAFALLLQWFVVSYYVSTATQMLMVFNIAAAAPVFFALGCAGTAWAIEREDETYRWLQAEPVSEQQVFASKLSLTLVATLAMFAVLWCVSLWMFRGQRPPSNDVLDLAGIWGIAAVEVIAWGMFFSLLMARPLPAILLALFVSSTFIHLLAEWASRSTGSMSMFSDYRHAAPYRLAVAAIVLAIDVAVGLRWLQGTAGTREPLSLGWLLGRRGTKDTAARTSLENVPLRNGPTRSAILSHLLWQQWRRSARHMILATVALALLTLTMTNSTRSDTVGWSSIFTLFTIVMSGVLVFLPDQERHGYRFFQEHNVPPRYVWLTRQLPWLATLVLAALLCLLLTVLFAAEPVSRELHRMLDPQANSRSWTQSRIALAVFTWFLVAYAVGQFCSMFIRSGLLAAVGAMMLTGLLAVWTLIVLVVMQLDWWWSAAPIPFLLMFATWLRAPDWVRENNTRWAWARVLAVTLLPAIGLYVLTGVVRVQQVPYAAWLPTWTPSPQARQTIELLRQADAHFVGYIALAPPTTGAEQAEDAEKNEPETRIPTPGERQWVADNAETLALLKQAAAGPVNTLNDPYARPDSNVVLHQQKFQKLLVYSGRLLESEGQLETALDAYIDAMHLAVMFANHSNWYLSPHLQPMFMEIAAWGAHEKQTSELVQIAIDRLQEFEPGKLGTSAWLESKYIRVRLAIDGDEDLTLRQTYEAATPTSILVWSKLLPWEAARADRVLNLLANTGNERLRLVLERLAESQGVVDYLTVDNHATSAFQTHSFYRSDPAATRLAFLRQTTPLIPLEATYPGADAIFHLVRNEAWRRATLLILALENHRRVHGKLPESLDALDQDFFTELPLDPYSGLPFGYFPEGLPNSENDDDRWSEAIEKHRLRLNAPYLWSTGPLLEVVQADHAYRDRRRGLWNTEHISSAAAAKLGIWFPIPSPAN